MNTQFTTLFYLCIIFIIPFVVLSTSAPDYIENSNNDVDNNFARLVKSSYHRYPYRSAYYNDHVHLKKAADFEQILKPCNQMPASGRGNEYTDCVRSRMLLLGRRKRQAQY